MMDWIESTRRLLEAQRDMGIREFWVRPDAWDPWKVLRREVEGCRKCQLWRSRRRVVFGAGDTEAGIMFVGEAPGEEEDLRGEPFVGAAGELLTRMIRAIRMERREVYIANVLKCRPPGNRDPLPEEIEACKPYLFRQIELVKPKVICALGRIAGGTLLGTSLPLSRLRGKVHFALGTKVVVTFHPAALLRNPGWKRQAWEDMKLLRREYDGLELRR